MAENVAAQLDVAVHFVVVQLAEGIDFKAVKCLDCQTKVVTFVAVGVATAGERVVALAALTDKTVQQDQGGFVLRCLLAKRYDSERY